MAISLGNRAKMSTSTTGTGTITLGSASTGYQTFDAAGITNGQTVRYAIEDGSNFEIGSGTYTTSGTTLTRTVTESNNSDNAITLSGSALVFITATVADLFVNDGASNLTTTGVGTFASLDISGDIDVDGTTNLDVVDIDGAVNIAADLTIASTNKILFNDASQFIQGSSATVLTIAATDEIDLTATTIDINGAVALNGAITGATNITLSGELDAATGDFSGDVDVDGTLEADAITLNGTAVTATATLDTGISNNNVPKFTSGVADNDFLRVDGTAIEGRSASEVLSDIAAAPAAGSSNIVTTGALNSGSITSGFGAINNGASNITTTGVGTFASLDISGDIDVDGTTNLDAVDIDGAVNMATTALITGVLTTTAATVFNGGFASNADSLVGTDKKIKFRDAAIYINSSADGQLDIVADTEIQIAATTIDINGAINASGEIIAASLDISGNADIDGTLETDGLTVGGVAAKVAGLETIWIPATAMYPATTNGSSALTQVETTALRPDLMVLDFAAAADDFAQFSIGFPKSWNEGTVKFQVFWTPSNTNTDDCIWGLQGVSVADGATIDVVYGTAITVTDAGIGTVEDQQVSPVSGAVTITNAAVDTQTYFQIFRDGNAGGDTFSGVSRLLGIKLFFTTDAANDA